LIVIPHELNLSVNGQAQTLRTRAWTVESALAEAGIAVTENDQLDPPAGTFLIGKPSITLEKAAEISIYIYPGGEQYRVASTERTPTAWLDAAGLALARADKLTINGIEIDPESALPYAPYYSLNLHQAQTISLSDGEWQNVFNSSAATLGQALWEQGIVTRAADYISLPLDTPLDHPLEVALVHASPVHIQLAEGSVETFSAAESVGEALAETGISLQKLDYTLPAEVEPIPDDRMVKVVRVTEEVQLIQQPIPYEVIYQQDANTELDTRQVIQAGELGVQVNRERIRYEDGVESGRVSEAAWTAKEPQDQIVGLGINPVVRTVSTPDGTIEYWRAVTVYATSYSPCRLGIPDYCNYTTASGLPVSHGIIAVTRAWYSWMAGQPVYVPGYGKAIVADVGGGIPGRYWIDLAYTDATYVSWARYTTLYFLTPVPASIPWVLP
jgi:uncharacterized protein YabE (DUF348 family)